MGATKTEMYSDDILQQTLWGKAIDHPARIQILKLILSEKSCICRDISRDLKLSQPTITQHLTVLKKSGLIRGKIKGRQVCYCADKKACRRFLDYIDALFKSIK